MRCNRVQASMSTDQATSMLHILIGWRQKVAKKSSMVIVTLLGLGGTLWFTVEAKAQNIGDKVETALVELSIDRQPKETYEALLNRATVAAKTAVQESFDQNSKATDVSITVVAHNQGAIVPVLSLEVNRSQLLSEPNIQRQITYFTSARSLLRFDQDVATTNSNRQPNTTPSGQSRTTNPLLPRRPLNTQNNRPRSGRERINGTFSQPGTVTPTTSGQPVNIPGQSGNGIPTNPSNSQTPPPGTGLVPQPPVAAPIAPAVNPQSPNSTNNTSPSVPSTSTPTTAPQNPFAPSTNGTTPLNSSGNFNNNTRGTTPNQVPIPESSSSEDR